MKTLETLTHDERSLLLYFETLAVDYSGKVDSRRMNEDDFRIAEIWDSEGFIEFGRIIFDHGGGYYCNLSEEAWKLAHEVRKARAVENWQSKGYTTVREKNLA
jgi:hypothetical protein